MKVTGFIPARFKSTRFPGKPLVDINGKPMIQWVYERASQASLLDKIIVLTDDQRIYDKVKGFGGDVLITSENCKSGTERIISVLDDTDCDIAVNIQGDEPLIDPKDIDKAARLVINDEASISTLIYKINDPASLNDPNIVKVVIDSNDFALYFSRAGVPYNRDDIPDVSCYQHIGLYVYKKDVLLGISSLPESPLEKAEKLEQLRFLENGYSIKTIETKNLSIGIDEPIDIERALLKEL